MTVRGRGLVGGLGGAAALLAFTVGAVSLTRFAGDYLGFPSGLEWTFTGAVDVAGIAGGVMWTGFSGAVRRIGRPMSIVCTTVSGIGVGLDHATHAGRALRESGGADWLAADPAVWAGVAFVAGLFIPALVTWILHALAVMADQTETRRREGRRDAATPTASHREATPRAPDREAETPAPGSAAALVATTVTPDREALPAGSRDGDGTGPLPRIHPAPDPGQKRPAWITDELVAAVVESIRATDGGRKNYGVPSVVRDHTLPGGGKIGSHRAGMLLEHADELMQAAS